MSGTDEYTDGLEKTEVCISCPAFWLQIRMLGTKERLCVEETNVAVRATKRFLIQSRRHQRSLLMWITNDSSGAPHRHGGLIFAVPDEVRDQSRRAEGDWEIASRCRKGSVTQSGG